MKHRRQPPRPDARPDWRDPQMPVVRTRKDGTTVEIPPDRVTIAMQKVFAANTEPHYTRDPTYNLRKPKS